MPKSPPPSESSPERWGAILVSGDEAHTFLQGQLSQDLDGLGEEGRWTLVLAPDSAVVASGVVSRTPDGLLVTLNEEFLDEVHARLKRFLLRTKCSLEVIGGVSGPFASTRERLNARWPGAGELRAHLSPHSYGRSGGDATISFTKGCFTGQELGGRLDARGASVPWRAIYFEATESLILDELLRSCGPAGPQGVTTLVASEEGVRGMGIAHRTLLSREDFGDVRLSALA